MKVLVLEKNNKVYKTFLYRVVVDRLTKLGADVEVVRTTNLHDTFEALISPEVNLALLDFISAAKIEVDIDGNPVDIRDSAALVKAYREGKGKIQPKKVLIGIASTHIGNLRLLQAGVDKVTEKHLIHEALTVEDIVQ